MPREVGAKLFLPSDGEHLANDAVLVGKGSEPFSPVVDEEIAEDHASVSNGEARPEIGDAPSGERAGEKQHEVLADRRAEARRAEDREDGEIREPAEQRGEHALHDARLYQIGSDLRPRPVPPAGTRGPAYGAPSCRAMYGAPCWTQSPRGSAPPSTS